MGIGKAFKDAVSGTFADMWKDIITVGSFDELAVVLPGEPQVKNNKRGENGKGEIGYLSNGSKIFVPENTAAFIFSQAGIEQIITESGAFEYHHGQASRYNKDKDATGVHQFSDRLKFGGQTSQQKKIAFVNLREIRGIKFGTNGPLVYNDPFYGADLEVFARGAYVVKVVDPARFIRNFVPANKMWLSFANPKTRAQLNSEFLQSFAVTVNSLAHDYRIFELPSKSNEISKRISDDTANAGSWKERFGLDITHVAIENIEFTPKAKELVNKFNEKKMGVNAYAEVSQEAANMAAQQKIAQGVQDNGLGDGGGMIFGMNMAKTLGPQAQSSAPGSPQVEHKLSFDEQIESLKKLKDLVDVGILTQEEFEMKKKEMLGL